MWCLHHSPHYFTTLHFTLAIGLMLPLQRVKKVGKVYSMEFFGQPWDQSTLVPYCAYFNWALISADIFQLNNSLKGLATVITFVLRFWKAVGNFSIMIYRVSDQNTVKWERRDLVEIFQIQCVWVSELSRTMQTPSNFTLWKGRILLTEIY